MPQTLNIKAIEESSIIITAAFTDEDDQAVAPTSATWTLTDTYGNVINSREDVAISTPSSSEDIVLSGADLPVLEEGKDQKLILTVKALYDSAAGSGLALKDSVWIDVEDLKAESS